MQFFAHWIVTVILCICKIVNKEINGTVNANHVTNVVVAENSDGKRYYIKLEFSVFNNALNASGVNSHAEGNNTTASGVGSHAEGYGTEAMKLLLDYGFNNFKLNTIF